MSSLDGMRAVAAANAKSVTQHDTAADWQAFEDENTTFVTREQLREMYQRAVGHKFGFLYYRPRSGDVENMFYDSFTQRLIPS